MRQRIHLAVALVAISLGHIEAATAAAAKIHAPFVNQAGYNLGESKHFVCYGAKDGMPFHVIDAEAGAKLFTGRMLNHEGWFTAFNPRAAGREYVVEVEGHGRSDRFWIADHLIQKLSTKLAYDFFVDARGFEDLATYDPSKVYSGGPTRDGGAFGLETVFEVLQYAANPAVFDRWTGELGDPRTPDLIELILWHADFAYRFHAYNGPVLQRHGSLGYPGAERMSYDYWNTLDQLAAVCAAYHGFLKPYLPEETYQKYRKVCLDNWQAYDRHKVVRFWTYSTKWVDQGFQEFNEMGNAYGQSVFSNLFMYLCEKAEGSDRADQFLAWAKESGEDIIANWDFNNPRHMWWIRNAEHITPQALGWFQLLLPDQAPPGTRDKLAAWSLYMKRKTSNFWRYRTHSETEWAHPKTKELGGAPALGGSMFLIAHLLDDPELRAIGWAQVDFVFGVNPVGTHLSNKSPDRLSIGGYWEGVEQGWPSSHPGGFGRLGKVRGTLDGSPLDGQFPIADAMEAHEGKNLGADFGNKAYATEGWGISNRGWMATTTFSTLGTHRIRFLDSAGTSRIAGAAVASEVVIELRAALNFDWNAPDHGWVELQVDGGERQRIPVIETGADTGIFTARWAVPDAARGKAIDIRYGYLGLETRDRLVVSGN